MGRIRKSFKSHVENMVTCGLSKSYQQFGSENHIIEDSISNVLDLSRTLSSSSTASNMIKPTKFDKNSNKSFGYNCSECGHKGMIENDELDPVSSVEVLKDKMNNKNNNSEQSSRPKCDITNRKRTSDDVLLSCIVVNNDLHGKNENNNTVPVNMSKTMAGMKFSPLKNNRAIDTLIRRRFLQIFSTTSSENKDVTSTPKFPLNSKNQMQNKMFVTKQNNIQNSPQNNFHHHHQCSKNSQSTTLSESSKGFPIKHQSMSSTLPFNLSNVLNTTSCNDTNCLWAKVTRTEEVQLRNAAWYQPGLSREIVNEELSNQQLPYGTFLVRSSLTHPDSFALSIKVPLTSSAAAGSQQEGDSSISSPASIAHYLIIASLSHGYRINGSVKSFPTLYSLIVHHSVMKEILPCALNLSVASRMRLCEQHHFSHTKESRNNKTTEEEGFGDLTQNIELLSKDSKDVSDADYPDLLCTLRKALLASSFSDETKNLISLF